MDSRFNDCTILDRRKEELNMDNIKENIDLLFSKISILPGWSFVSSDWSENIKHTQKEEIKRSVIRTLKIKLKSPSGEELLYPIQFPELINEQFFYIGGFLKVPVFQLIDKPIIYRKIGNSNFILKLRTNTISIEMEKDKKSNFLISIYGKKILLEHLFCSTHTKELYEQWKVTNERILEESEAGRELISYMDEKCIPIWNEIDTEDKMNAIVGEYFMNYPNEKYAKGSSIRFSLFAAQELDIYNSKYMKCDSLLLEILQAYIDGERSDTDIKHKRVRLLEYIISPLIKKLFDMIVVLFKNPDSSFKIPQTIIVEKCNVSDIVHYNFPLNPVGEIAGLMQCTLTGPNGFKKSNVPLHLRNLDDSQFGYFCPIDTPDREGCGVVLNFVPTIDITPDGEFGTADESIITSYPINLTPFNSNDDGTRLQMASNQAKQSILIKDSERPWVKSGIEDCYLERTTFLGKAKENGIVVYKDDRFLIVKYDTGEYDVFRINYRSMYLNTVDILDSYVEKFEKFKKDQILVQSRFLKDGEMALGRTLNTLIMPMFGFNYEDGIILSESTTNKMVSSHFVDLSFEIESGQVLMSLTSDCYSPIPKVGDKLRTGQAYAKIKCLDWEDGFEAINEEPMEKTAPIDCTITSIEVYPNQWNKKVDEFNKFIQDLINEQSAKYNELVSILKENMTNQEIKNFIIYNGLSYLNCEKNIGKYSLKNDIINGVKIKINAVYEEPIGIGDKIANRHGNKGIISEILPDEKMPKLDDGRTVDIVINSLGIISRMNPGQVFELQIGECIDKLRKKMLLLKEPEDEKLLATALKIIDETPTLWITRHILDEYETDKKELGKEEAIKNLYLIMPPFESTGINNIVEKLMTLLKVKAEFSVSIPEVGKIKNDIAAGYMYWLKLVHRANDKLSARSVGTYSQKTSQPLGGKKKGGGHRFGEMEQWALVSHGADSFLKDLMTIHSDSIGLKNVILAKMLRNAELIESDADNKPQSLMLLDSYLAQIGLEIVDE